MTSQSTSDLLNTVTKLLPNQTSFHLNQAGFQDCKRMAVTAHGRPTILKACGLHQDSHHTFVRYFSLVFFAGSCPDSWKSKVSHSCITSALSYLPSRSECTVVPCQCSMHGKSVRPQTLHAWGHRALAKLSQILLLPSPAQGAWGSSAWFLLLPVCSHAVYVKGHLGHMAQSGWHQFTQAVMSYFQSLKINIISDKMLSYSWRKGQNLNLTCYGNTEPSSSFKNLGESQLTLKEGMENYTLCNEKKLHLLVLWIKLAMWMTEE